MPSAKGMFIGVEPFIDKQYLGAMIEHPNHEGVYIIEFGTRLTGFGQGRTSGFTFNGYILYDAKQNCVTEHNLSLTGPGISRSSSESLELLSAALVRLFNYNISILGCNPDISHQMEFGMDMNLAGAEKRKPIEGSINIMPYQIRAFRWKTPLLSSSSDADNASYFEISPSYNAQSVMGITDKAGIDCVVINTTDPIEFAVISERARKEGYGVCYVSRPRESAGDVKGDNAKEADIAIANYVEGIDVLVTGKSLAVMKHGYFNAMVNADHVLLLTQAQIAQFKFEQGSVINYKSNGRDVSVTPVDSAEKVKYKIREMLNNKS